MLAGHNPAQEAANAVWQQLAEKYGFKWDTVRPVEGYGEKIFEAQANEAVKP